MGDHAAHALEDAVAEIEILRAALLVSAREREDLRVALTALVACLTEGGNGEGWVLSDFIEQAERALGRFSNG